MKISNIENRWRRLLRLSKEDIKYTGCFWNRRPCFRKVLYGPEQRRKFMQTSAS